MILVERDTELGQLRAVLDNCADGNGGAILVSGPSGSGKSALLRAAAAMAIEREFVVMTATAVAPGKRCDVLEQLWHNTVHSPAPAGDFDENSFWPRCQELAEQRPVLIVVDDIDLADQVSLEYGHHIGRRLCTSRICVVMSRCAATDAPDWWADLERQPHVHQVRVGSLSPDRVSAWLGPGWYESTGGSPLLLHALLADGGEPGDATDDAVLRCLNRSGLRLLGVARGVAVLDTDATLARLSALLDMDDTHVSSSLRALAAAGLLEGCRFRIAAAANAVMADMPQWMTFEMRSKAALMLHGDGAPADAVARQLLAMGSAPDWGGVDILEEAAEHALRDSRRDFAMKCLTRALAFTEDEKVLARIRMRLVANMWQIDPSMGARHLSALVQACHAGLLTGTHAATVCRQLLWHGRTDAAFTLLRQVADGTIAWDVDTPTALRIARLWLMVSYPEHAEIVEPVRIRDTASPLGLRLHAVSTYALVLTQGVTNDSVSRVLRLLELLRSRFDDDSALLALLSLVHAEQATAAAEWAATMPDTPVFMSVRAEIALRLGDLPGAVAAASAALDLPAGAWGVAVGGPLGALIAANTAMGRFAEAEELLRRPVPEAMYGTRFALPYLHARGAYQLAIGRPTAALPDFLACGELMRAWRLDHPGLMPWRVSAAQALIASGRPKRARQLLEEPMAGQGQRSKGMALRQVAACRPVPERPKLLSDAADLLLAAGDDLQLAYVLADLAEARHEMGDDTGVRALLRKAYTLAEACGAQPLCERLKPPRRTRRTGGLTAAERRVAELAARDYTNREIADVLHITPSTVEQHLTRIFRKLEVKQRGALAGLLRAPAGSVS